jgi:N-acetylglutamate synthase/N-acetylornithine aminotransferase
MDKGSGVIGPNVAIFLGFTVCLEFALNSLFWGHKQLSASSKVSQTSS